MKSYLIHGLTGEEKKKLQDSGVVYEDFSMKFLYFWKRTYVLVEENHLDGLLQSLNMTADKQKRTRYQGIFTVRVNRPQVVDAATAQWQQEQRNLIRARSRATYIKVCGARVKAAMDQATNELTENKKNLASVEEQFVKHSRALAFGGGSRSDGEMRKEFAAELQRLLEVDKVKDVRVTSGRIHVFTETLHATNPDTGKRHELGQFMITIRISGKESGVSWINSTRRVDGVQKLMNAPTVYADGSARVDEIRETLLELIARCEFSVVAELAIQFVETVNKDEYGKHIKNWPLAKA